MKPHHVRTWNDRRLRIVFRSTLSVRDSGAGSFSALVEGLRDDDAHLHEALRAHFDAVPDAHPYLTYTFLDADGESSLEVVASAIEATVLAKR